MPRLKRDQFHVGARTPQDALTASKDMLRRSGVAFTSIEAEETNLGRSGDRRRGVFETYEPDGQPGPDLALDAGGDNVYRITIVQPPK